MANQAAVYLFAKDEHPIPLSDEQAVIHRELKRWIRQYPNQLDRIYGQVVNHVPFDTQRDLIQSLQTAGWDINKASHHYDSDSRPETPLGSACEYRNLSLVRCLLDCKANPTIRGNKLTPLESVFTGHSALDTGTDAKEVLAIAELLLAAGSPGNIRRWIWKEHVSLYKNQATFKTKFCVKRHVHNKEIS